jgi:hypothetical protein
LGIGDWGLGPIPNPQSPIPNPQSPIPKSLVDNKNNIGLSNILILIKNKTKLNQIYLFLKDVYLKISKIV